MVSHDHQVLVELRDHVSHVDQVADYLGVVNSLFAGAGFKVLTAVDLDEMATRIYRLNHLGVFRRYAAESISFTTLARHLERLGFRTSYGGRFLRHHVESLLEDAVHIGYSTDNRPHSGKLHRFADDRVVPELNNEQKQTRNDRADWVLSRRLFKLLVDQKTWDAVQRKLDRRSKRVNAPRTAAQYLSALVHCGN